KRVWFRRVYSLSELLQPHCRLPFEGNLTRKAQQRRRRVEKPTDRTGGKSSHFYEPDLQIAGSALESRKAARRDRASPRPAPRSRPQPAQDTAPRRHHPAMKR